MRDLVSVYEDFAKACRSKGGLVSSDVEFQFDTSSGGEAAAINSEKYVVTITQWKDEPVLPFFLSKIPKQKNASGVDCIVSPQDALSLSVERRVLDSLLRNKLVELIGVPGIGKTNSLILFLIRLLRNMGQPYDQNDSLIYSSEVFLRTSNDHAFRFYLEEVEEEVVDEKGMKTMVKTGEKVVKVERVKSDIEELSEMFNERTEAAKKRGEVLPTLLLELDEEEERNSDPNVFGRVVVTASIQDLDETFKTLEKSQLPYVRVLKEPLSEGMMIAAVRGLVRHSKHRDTDPFLSQFVDKDGKEIEGEICKVVRERYFNVGGFMRDLICNKDFYKGVLLKTKSQALAKDRWNLLRGLSMENIPKGVKYLAMPVYTDPTLPQLLDNMQFTFRSGLASQLVCCNVSTLSDVEALRQTDLYSNAIERAWMYAALLDKDTFGYTSPATWDKKHMQFFIDPGHSQLDSKKHVLRGGKVPVFPLCKRVTFFDKTAWQHPRRESIRDLTQGVLYVSRSSSTTLCEYFTVCHNKQIVYSFNTSSMRPEDHPNDIETDLKAVMRGIGMFSGEGLKYKLQLVYVVDAATPLTGTMGWTLTDTGGKRVKICDLAKLSPEHFAFPSTVGSNKSEDRVQGVIVKFQPWGFIMSKR